MTKIKLLSIAVVGLLLVNAGILAFLVIKKPAEPPMGGPGRPGPGGEGPKRIIIERLHFDAEQTAKYEKLITEHRKQINELDREIRTTKNNLYSTLSSASSLNKDSLETRLGEIQKQIESTHYNHFSDIKKLCKPDQLENFNDLTKELARFFAPGKNLPPPPRD
jgi:protein CpxP